MTGGLVLHRAQLNSDLSDNAKARDNGLALCLQYDADPVDVRNVTICNLDFVAIVMPSRIDSRWEFISNDRIDEHVDRRAILPQLPHASNLKGLAQCGGWALCSFSLLCVMLS